MTLLNDTRLELPQRLKAARLLAGLEQNELAEQIGVARSTVSNWERGHAEPGVSNFVKLARVTGQPLDWFAEAIEARPEGFEPPTYWSVAELEDICPCEWDHEDPHEPCYCSCHGSVDEGLEARFWTIVADLEEATA